MSKSDVFGNIPKVNQDILGTVKSFDKNAIGYDNNSLVQYSQGLPLIKCAIKQACHLVKSKSLKQLHVLDVGCGSGRTTIKFYVELRKELIKIFPDIKIYFVGIDISPNMIQQSINNAAIEGFSQNCINFYNKNVEELTEEDGVYDIMFSNSVLHWCTPKAYVKIFERLKSGGFLIAQQGGESCYKELHQIVWKSIDDCNLSKYFKNWQIPLFYPSQNEMETIIKQIGYQNIVVKDHRYVSNCSKALIDAFANASLLIYYSKLPNDDLKDKLKDKYFALCNELSTSNITIHRLYIFATKK